MEIIVQIILIGLGFLMLTKGADWFVDGAAGLAERLRIPQLFIGLTVVAMGTSAPEAAISISSALKGSTDITVGNIIGSNIMNILVILGVAALIITLKVAQSAVRIEIPFMIAVFIILIILGLDGYVGFYDGLILWALFIVYIIYLFIIAKREAPPADIHDKGRSLLMAAISTLTGMALIIWGSDLAVDSATDLAVLLGISERMIGLTIVALGTSLPELVTTVTAAKKGDADIAIGNIIGSCIFNVLFVLGTSAIIIPVAFSPKLQPDAWIAAASALLLFFSCLRKNSLARPSGILFLICYFAYFVFFLL